VSTPRGKVLIHALGADIGGGLRHLRSFLPALAHEDSSTQYVVLIRRGLDLSAPSPNIRLVTVAPILARSPALRLFYDVVLLPFLPLMRKCDSVVTLTNFGPLIVRARHICFQRNSLYYCPYYLSRLRGAKRIEIALRTALLAMTMRRASVVVTPSDSMAAMIRRAVPTIPAHRFRTLYHGVAAEDMREPLDPAVRERIRRLPGPLLLYPSHLAFYKGFTELFELLAFAKGQGLRFSMLLTVDERDGGSLVADYRDRIDRLGLTGDVHFIGRVAQRQVGDLYEACDAMVFPSMCESFGFPLLEAMAHGLPVIASDIPVNREICGDAAVYFDPSEARSGALALSQALREKARLASAAATRVTGYDWSWARYAREFVELATERSACSPS
jgi:glycosyltransferase involved in cell wall biosynthesis